MEGGGGGGGGGGGVGGGGGTTQPSHKPEQGRISPSSSSQQSLITTKRERSPTPSEPMSPLNINPPSPADSSKLFSCKQIILNNFSQLNIINLFSFLIVLSK